jgi:Leu/Phe-tRNA-protein transferase
MKMPPREKIHEALSAIVDDRVIIDNQNNKAIVYSSNRSKEYIVEWNDNIYSSNDNATFWQGYPGYPVIATLLIQNKIDYDKNITKYFKDINWKELNTKFNNDYSKAVEFIYSDLKNNNIDTDYIDKEIDNIYHSLENLNIAIKRSKVFPPK